MSIPGLKKILPPLFAAALLLAVSACGRQEAVPTPTVDPHAGMVQVADGFGERMWITPYGDLPVSDFDPAHFTVDGAGVISYTGGDYTVLNGIDISEHQGEVDWDAVAGAGVEFVILRAGYRGYSEGGLFEDAYFAENLRGAKEAGLKVGCYFFSQAVSCLEAEEEADYLLSLVDGEKLDMPVFFDWEEIGPEARTCGVTDATLTNCCLVFCGAVEEAGYETGVYFYRRLGYEAYQLDRLSKLNFWAGALGESPDFYYAHSFWQYSITGLVPGVETCVDRDLWFVPNEKEPPAPLAPTPASQNVGENNDG
jgi:lysozyme